MACAAEAAKDVPVTDWKAEALKSVRIHGNRNRESLCHRSSPALLQVSSPEQTQVSDLWLTLFWAALVSPRRSAVCFPRIICS